MEVDIVFMNLYIYILIILIIFKATLGQDESPPVVTYRVSFWTAILFDQVKAKSWAPQETRWWTQQLLDTLETQCCLLDHHSIAVVPGGPPTVQLISRDSKACIGGVWQRWDAKCAVLGGLLERGWEPLLYSISRHALNGKCHCCWDHTGLQEVHTRLRGEAFCDVAHCPLFTSDWGGDELGCVSMCTHFHI